MATIVAFRLKGIHVKYTTSDLSDVILARQMIDNVRKLRNLREDV